MESIFLRIVNMSITAGWLVPVILLLRLALKNAPKAFRCALWGLVGIRLLLPFSFESVLSLIPSAEPIPLTSLQAGTLTVDTGIPALDQAVNPAIGQVFVSAASGTAENALPAAAPTVMSVTRIAALVWIAGMTAMLLYTAVSYWHLRRRVTVSMPGPDRLLLCDAIETPFILGIFRPRIYIPSAMPAEQVHHVAAHERAHLQRRDHWWKPLGFLLLSIHWFHPLLWLAYILLCRDIELACDEKVIRDMGAADKKAYSLALLETSVPRRMIAACPLAFGEVGVRSRIRSVLHYKKPAFWLLLTATALSVTAAVCLLTNPYDRQTRLLGGEYKVENILYETAAAGTPTVEYCVSADLQLYHRPIYSEWEYLGSLLPYSLTTSQLKDYMYQDNGWRDSKQLPSVTDAYALTTEEQDWYIAMQLQDGRTLLAKGWEDVSERNEYGSDDTTIHGLYELENQLGEHEFNVDFFARSLRDTVGSSVEPFAYWSHAHKPGYAVVAFHAGAGNSQSDMPDMGYAVFETETGGYLLKDWYVYPGSAQTPSRMIVADPAVLGDISTDANTYDVILSSNPDLYSVRQIFYKDGQQIGERKHLADNRYSLLLLPWDAYPEANSVALYYYDEEGRLIDPDTGTIPEADGTAASVLPMAGQAVSPDQQYEIRLNGADTGVSSGGAYPPESITIHDRTSSAVLWEDTGYYHQAALWSPDGSRLALARTAHTYCFITIINTRDWTAQNADLRMPDGSTMEEYIFLRDDAGDFGTGMRWLSEGDLQISLTSAPHQTDYQAIIRTAASSSAILTVRDEWPASVRIPAVLDNADPFPITYSLPAEVTAPSDWNYDADIQKIAEYSAAELELYDLREPWEATLYLRWGSCEGIFKGTHINPGGLTLQHSMTDADGDGQQELVVIGTPGTGTGVSVDSLHIFRKTDGGITRYTLADLRYLRESVEPVYQAVVSAIDPATRTIGGSLNIPNGLDINPNIGSHISFSMENGAITGTWGIHFVRTGTAFTGSSDYTLLLTADIIPDRGSFLLTNLRLSQA